jgi:hypothetical protein
MRVWIVSVRISGLVYCENHNQFYGPAEEKNFLTSSVTIRSHAGLSSV